MSGRPLNILVAGGFDPTNPGSISRPISDIVAFAGELGREIIDQGHTLLTGCRTPLDAAMAKAAYNHLKSLGRSDDECRRRIVSYVNQGVEAAFADYGTVLQSELADWELGSKGLNPPEIIRDADAVILVGGYRGTFRAANWSRIQHKPLLPIALFGGATREICQEETKRVETLYPGNVSRADYEKVLKSLSTNWAQRAKDTVSLAERLTTSREVFIVMSFATLDSYTDLRTSIEDACKEHGYVARRVDETNPLRRIIPEIINGIAQCAFVVADVTEQKPNVFWELGLAAGMGKDIIVVAKDGSTLPFDIIDIPVLFWNSFTRFKGQLAGRVQAIAARQGRA